MFKAATHITFHKRNFQTEHEVLIRGGFPPRDSHLNTDLLPECLESIRSNQLPPPQPREGKATTPPPKGREGNHPPGGDGDNRAHAITAHPVTGDGLRR